MGTQTSVVMAMVCSSCAGLSAPDAPAPVLVPNLDLSVLNTAAHYKRTSAALKMVTCDILPAPTVQLSANQIVAMDDVTTPTNTAANWVGMPITPVLMAAVCP